MKIVRPCASALIALLLLAALLLSGCRGNDTPADTTDAADTPTSADTTAPESPDTPDTPAETEPDTEPETEAPVELSADEVRSLLAAALEREIAGGTVTVKTYTDGELYSENRMAETENAFMAENMSMGITERLTAVDGKVYYYVSMVDGVSKTEARYVFTPTAEERDALYAMYMGGDSTATPDDELTEGLLNSTLAGKRYQDGRAELTCTDLDAELVTQLMGAPVDGTIRSFEFSLDAEGRMTVMRFTMTVPSVLTGGTETAVTSETHVNYAAPAITAPADADAYAKVTYDDLFGYQLPEIDPEAAAALGLPVDGDGYTVGGEDAAVDPAEQYEFLYLYAPYYADKTFTVYGNVSEDEYGNILVSVGENMDFVVYFDGVDEPVVGAYVKVTATLTQTVDYGDYVDFDCYTLMATACETLGEAVGPNGGKYMFITASALNVRTSSDTSSSANILGTLSHGDMVEVFEQDEKGWYRIIFNGQDAYISNKYVSETKP